MIVHLPSALHVKTRTEWFDNDARIITMTKHLPASEKWINSLLGVLKPADLVKAQLSLGNRSQEDEWLDLTELRRRDKIMQVVYEHSTKQICSVSWIMWK